MLFHCGFPQDSQVYISDLIADYDGKIYFSVDGIPGFDMLYQSNCATPRSNAQEALLSDSGSGKNVAYEEAEG